MHVFCTSISFHPSLRAVVPGGGQGHNWQHNSLSAFWKTHSPTLVCAPPPRPGCGARLSCSIWVPVSLLSLSASLSLCPCPDWPLPHHSPPSVWLLHPTIPFPPSVSLSLLYLCSSPSSRCFFLFVLVSFSPGVGLFLVCRSPTRLQGSLPESSRRDPRLSPPPSLTSKTL